MPFRRAHVGSLAVLSLPLLMLACEAASSSPPPTGNFSVPPVEAGNPLIPAAPEDAAVDTSPPSDATADSAVADAGVDATPDADVDAASDAGLEVDSGPSGLLDLTFAGTGYVSKLGTAGSPAVPADRGNALAIDSTNRIVVAGESLNNAGMTNAAAWRVTTAGAFDATFGNNGGWSTPDVIGGGNYASARAVTVDAQDRPLITGQSNNGYPIYAPIFRLTTAGAFDTSFAGTGYVGQTNTAGWGYDAAYAIKVDASGRYVLAGFTDAPAFAIDMATWRFSTNGTLDTSFAGTGYVTAHSTLGYNPGADAANTIAFDASNRVYVAGSSKDLQLHVQATVWRYTSAGVFDTTFANNGYANFGGITGAAANPTDAFSSMAVDGSGRIVVCGQGTNAQGHSRAFVGRLLTAGAPDNTFGTNGWTTLGPAPGGAANSASYAKGCAIDSKGRIVVAGISTDGSVHSMAVWRVTSAGALDATYGNAGMFATTGTAGATGAAAADDGLALALDGVGRAVVCGTSKNAAGRTTMAVWRLTP